MGLHAQRPRASRSSLPDRDNVRATPVAGPYLPRLCVAPPAHADVLPRKHVDGVRAARC